MLTNTQPTSGQLFKRLAVVVAVGIGAVAVSGMVPLLGQADWAVTHTDVGQSGTGGNRYQSGKGGQGGDTGHDTESHEDEDHGQGGQGGPGIDSEGKGPRAGAPSTTGGGRPVWAKEGIPEVELGRLNVARSPEHVLASALNEALSRQTPELTAFYSQSLDQAITQLSLNWDNVTIYDSPLQSLALFEQTLKTGSSPLPGVTNDKTTLEAMFLGVASDKGIPITTETVIAVTTILGSPLTGAAAEELAAEAEAVRIAVLAGHG